MEQKQYKDGRVERLMGEDVVDTSTGVPSKDVVLSPEIGVSARLYLPIDANPVHKVPLLVYFHGGGFAILSAFSRMCHVHVNLIVAEANVVVVSVDYRRPPESPLPAAYEDCWAAIEWATDHATGNGCEPWLKDYVDFDRIFFGGDSTGGNIAHHMAIRVESEHLSGFKLVGIFLAHPYFWGKEPLRNEEGTIDFAERLWRFAKPDTSGTDDPLINPVKDPKFPNLACSKVLVLVLVAEKDALKERGYYYYESWSNSNWGGKLNIEEAKDEHVFQLLNPTGDNSIAFVKRVAAFLNEN